jgi:hypothetical protein
MILKEIGYEDLGQIHVDRDANQWRNLVNSRVRQQKWKIPH